MYRRGGCTHSCACRGRLTVDLASLPSRDGACRVLAGPGACRRGKENGSRTLDHPTGAMWSSTRATTPASDHNARIIHVFTKMTTIYMIPRAFLSSRYLLGGGGVM
ncbi:unnamed protein product [Ectocarpus sp. 13 AM-2016]